MTFLFGCEHRQSSLIPQRLCSSWDLFFFFFFSTGDGANREQRLSLADSFSDHPQLADSADPPHPSCTHHKPPSLFHVSVAGVLLLPPPLLLLLLYCCPPPPPPPAVVVPFWWGVRQLIDAPREHLMSTRPPPARHHGENMSRVAARTRPGSILSLWRSGMEIIKQPFISSNCTLLS